MLEEIIKDKTDMFLISEIKLDSSFPSRLQYTFQIRQKLKQGRFITLCTLRHPMQEKFSYRIIPIENNRGINFYSSKYGNFIVLDDLNAEDFNSFLEQFFSSHNLKSLFKEPTCFKMLIIRLA